MGKVLYDFIITETTSLAEEIKELNSCQDKIVAVTEHGNYYTIFYERKGNEKDGEG
jgi:hypothetical protein